LRQQGQKGCVGRITLLLTTKSSTQLCVPLRRFITKPNHNQSRRVNKCFKLPALDLLIRLLQVLFLQLPPLSLLPRCPAIRAHRYLQRCRAAEQLVCPRMLASHLHPARHAMGGGTDQPAEIRHARGTGVMHCTLLPPPVRQRVACASMRSTAISALTLTVIEGDNLNPFCPFACTHLHSTPYPLSIFFGIVHPFYRPALPHFRAAGLFMPHHPAWFLQAPHQRRLHRAGARTVSGPSFNGLTHEQ